MRGALSLALPFGMQHDYASPQVSRSSVSLCLEWERFMSLMPRWSVWINSDGRVLPAPELEAWVVS